MKVQIPYICVSHMGNRRDTNQDNYICGHSYRERNQDEMKTPITGCIESGQPAILGVFDGMGGEEHGEIASFLAARKASEITFKRDAAKALTEFCMDANEEICRCADDHHYRSMGTTAAVIAFGKKNMTLCNIGDSKIFSFEGETLAQLSYDHLAAAPFGGKRPLSQCLGIPPSEMIIEPFLASRKYSDGELFLICSDGLTDMVSNEEISAALRSTGFPKAAEELFNMALDHGGKDNITFILCTTEFID